MPTTLTNAGDSAPTVSCENSIFSVCCAATTGKTNATNPQPAMPNALRLFMICMVDLQHAYKCLSKINFILIAKSLDDPFNILNQG